MQYCPYCSEMVSANAKTCHACKKSLDIDAIGNLIADIKSSDIDKSALRRIWFKEHARYFWPVFTLIIGILIGAAALFTQQQLSFKDERSALTGQIEQLNRAIADRDSRIKNAQSGQAEALQKKDAIITILTEERLLLSRIINFTRRLANNSQIVPNSPNDAQSYKNNYRYLKRLFDAEQEKLNATEYLENRTFNLQPVPQLLSD